MTDATVLDLDALVQPVGRVKVKSRVYEVLPVTGRAYQLIDNLAKQKPTAAGELIDISRRIVTEVMPTLPKEVREGLSVEQMTAIIGLSMNQVEKVQAMMTAFAGNGESPSSSKRRSRAAKGS